MTKYRCTRDTPCCRLLDCDTCKYGVNEDNEKIIQLLTEIRDAIKENNE